MSKKERHIDMDKIDLNDAFKIASKNQSKKVKDPNNENEKIAGYFIMEKYDMNVE